MARVQALRSTIRSSAKRLVDAFRTPAGGRTFAFLVALLLVLGASRENTPSWVVATAFVLYGVVALLWVWGQHRDNRRDDPWLMPPLGLAVLGVLAVGVFAWRLIDGAGLFAAILSAAVPAYLLAGFLLVRARALGRPPAWGRRLVLGGIAAGAVGFLSLGHWSPTVSGIGLAAFALLLLPGASVVAERRIRLVRAGRARIAPWLSWVLGGALFLGVLVVSRLVSGSDLVFLAFAALALLVFAVVSSTLLDVALLLAVIAFVGITPRQEPSPPDPEASEGTLVALGDSYMSGEGADTFYAGTDEGGGNGCRRAPSAWAAVAGQEAPFTGVEFLACSGARTYHVRLPAEDAEPPQPHEQRDEGDENDQEQGGVDDTQLQQYVDAYPRAADRNPALVVLSIGGNDAGFSTVGLMCLAPGDCSERQERWFQGLAQVEDNLALTYAEVRRTFPDSRVLVVPYPDPIYDGTEAAGARPAPNCDQVALAAGERRFIGDFVAALNDRIEAAAGDPGLDFEYLAGMETVLADAGLQLCHPDNDGRPGLNFIGVRSVSGESYHRFNPANWTHNSLHPNERGHEAMAARFGCWADAEFDEDDETSGDDCGGAAPERDLPDPGADGACDVYGELEEEYYTTNRPSCIAEGRDWAAEQAGRQGVLIAGGVVTAGAGIWLISTTFFGIRGAQQRSGASPSRRSPAGRQVR